MMPMNHNHQGPITLRVNTGMHDLVVANSSLIELKTCSTRVNAGDDTGNLGNYPGLVKSWTLKESP